MKNTKIYLAMTSLLMLLDIAANSSAYKPVHPKHKVASSLATHKSFAATAVDTWKPGPKLLSGLAEETSVGRYFLRLPEGYTELLRPSTMNSPSLAGFDSHVYGMNRRSDGTASTIALIIATPPPGMKGKLTLDDALRGTLEQKKSRWQNFTQSPAQNGSVSGIAFMRVYFKGLVSGAAGTRMAHGFAYVAIDGDSIINLQAEDVEPYNDETIPAAQASVLTLHK